MDIQYFNWNTTDYEKLCLQNYLIGKKKLIKKVIETNLIKKIKLQKFIIFQIYIFVNKELFLPKNIMLIIKSYL
jgi:hypothetical protein